MLFSESRLTVRVRPNDLDALGHLNNAVALEYLEAGRWDWIDQHDLVPGNQVIAVVARAEVDYLAEVPRTQVEIRTTLESPTADEFDAEGQTFRARFHQCIHLPQSTRPAVDAHVTVAFLDADARCLVTMQDFLAGGVARRPDPTVRTA
jgi:acyl-CoA thioester hydrolase